MVLRRLFGLPNDQGSGELETSDDVSSMPWWEKVSHPDPKVRQQGRREEQQEREAMTRHERG
jgi:hypothetical protein